MSDVVKFFLLGLGDAAVYALLASGIVVIYRGSGVVNFAQGGFALVGGYTYYELRASPTWVAIGVAVLVAALCGLVTELVVMWPMRRSSPLARVVATLGIVAVISQAAQIRYGTNSLEVHGFLPSSSLHISKSIILPQNRLWLFGIVAIVVVILWVGYRYTRFGVATSAVAENQDAAAALGWSPRAVAAVNWTIGAGLAGLAGVLFVPVDGLSPGVLSLAIVPALSAAIVGAFASFPLTLFGGLIIGVLESETTRWISTPGWNVAVPFLVIVAILVSQGKALPLRSFLSDRLPRPGTGRVRPTWAGGALVAVIGSTFLFTPTWSQAVTVSAIGAIVCLSLVVVTGYAGQISLAQYALAGMGGLISSRLTAAAGVAFPWSWILGVALTVAVGVLVALPALRARGVNLAVVTLGGALVIDSAVLSNINWTGGVGGTIVPQPVLFGLHLGSVAHPQRYATLCILLFGAASLMVANIRRGRAGRQLLAVRDNERAAASLGVSVAGAKIYAFGVGAALAGLAGVLAAFQYSNVQFSQYSPLQDINFVMLTVIGGLGFVLGATTAGLIVAGGVIEELLGHWFTLTDDWLLILGIVLVVQVMLAPDGIVAAQTEIVRRIEERFSPSRRRASSESGERVPSPNGQRLGQPLAVGGTVTVIPKALELRDITVKFGGTRALDELSLTVEPGEVLGLIGPNGAGKTTLIDVATGFVRPSRGEVLLGGKPVIGRSARQRVRQGLTRSWQALELFDVMTVEENLRTAAEPGTFLTYLADLIWPRARPLSQATQAIIREFQLGDCLDAYPDALPYAVRRLVGIGRAVATAPSVLLLDEPAAGLDEISTTELTSLIRRLAREWGMAVLLVEHDVSMVMAACDRVVAINFGREIVTGTPQEVRSHPGVIDAYLGAQDSDIAADDPDPPVGQDPSSKSGTTGVQA